MTKLKHIYRHFCQFIVKEMLKYLRPLSQYFVEACLVTAVSLGKSVPHLDCAKFAYFEKSSSSVKLVVNHFNLAIDFQVDLSQL